MDKEAGYGLTESSAQGLTGCSQVLAGLHSVWRSLTENPLPRGLNPLIQVAGRLCVQQLYY